ncbi:MAG TPA: MauE/DoxX family redox-associated membrane protein [Actinomycetota bacterium]|nr:MauE/DoxX family redox-associated membrane protein [Actinomycetota bacterium]
MVSPAALFLAAAFAWAAAAKAVRFPAWREALAGYRLPAPAELAARPLVPLAEGVTAALLVAGGDASPAGAAAAVALLAGFSLAVLRARRLQGDRLPCGCFGGSGHRDYRLMLVRNATLGAVAAVALLFPETGSFDAAAPDASQVVPAALAAAGLGLVVWLALAARKGFRR